MNEYAALRRKNTGRLSAVLALFLCVVMSGCMLFSRLLLFTPGDTNHYIPLTRGNGHTRVTVTSGLPRTSALGTPLLLAAYPGFQVTDESTVWSSETDIEIFRISYENGESRVTVNSQNADAVLAPGTSNTYSFVLENTGNVPLEYTMSMEAYFSHTDYPIPVAVRLTDLNGEYLLGSEEEAAPVLELNGISREGTVRVAHLVPYTLQWEWPFEQDDAYDTLLGNMATQEDITLTIVIRTTASCTDTVNPGDDEPPKTGDTTAIALLLMMMVGSFGGILLLLLPRKKREERHG